MSLISDQDKEASIELVPSAAVKAPATIGGLGIGEQVLGFPIEGPGAMVTAAKILKNDPLLNQSPVIVNRVEGEARNLSRELEKNPAGAALLAMIKEEGFDFGFKIDVDSDIPSKAGLGDLEALAVAAVSAANAQLEHPLDSSRLLQYAWKGAQAAGVKTTHHLAPSLIGGLTITIDGTPLRARRVPLTSRLHCIVGKLESKNFSKDTPMGAFGGVILGCLDRDLALIRSSFQAANSAPKGFEEFLENESAVGLGCSDSGPYFFAWTENESRALEILPELEKKSKNPCASFALNLQGVRLI